MEAVLVGKVDGRFEETGEIIEAKERRNRLFKRVVEYERVQLHCYMHLTRTRCSVLRERYDGHVMEHVVPFDEDFWRETIAESHCVCVRAAEALPDADGLFATRGNADGNPSTKQKTPISVDLGLVSESCALDQDVE